MPPLHGLAAIVVCGGAAGAVQVGEVVPQGCDPETLVAVAGSHWYIKHAFETAKQEVGLGKYEVRSAHCWYRHVTLALRTLALLAVVRAADLARPDPQKSSKTHGLAAFRRSRGLGGA